MHVEIFSLCDAATADFNGKMNILGAFDTIVAEAVPAVNPQCTIALRIRFDSIEKGDHSVSVNFVDQDGKHIIPPANGEIAMDFPSDQRSSSANLIFTIQGLRLAQFGEYSIDLAIDGRHEGSLPLIVKRRQK